MPASSGRIEVDLSGKTALVTGASGLGAHFAKVLAKAGAAVIVGARRVEALALLAKEIAEEGGQCRTISLDVTSVASIAAAADVIANVDILINNAGIAREGHLLDLSEDDWDAVMDPNAKGLFLMTQAIARAMKARGTGGSIINIASILGLRQGGMVASYAASKAAAIQLTKVSALELAPFGIRVNAIAPGYFATDINADFFNSNAGAAMIKRMPQRRLGKLDDLDGPLLLLASSSSAYMTGSVIEVDGGHLVSTH
jgi:NAD(P)-dependent dehydrogenase (short-subunit alcohol dehydrogenase family)